MGRRRPGGTGECWRRQVQLSEIMQSSCGKYYVTVCSEVLLGHGLYEMAFLPNTSVTKRDVMNGVIYVLYQERTFIGNLFIYTFGTQIFVLDASYLIFKIVWKRNKDEWCSVTSQMNTVFSYLAV
jgi:hypothetical protein